MFCKVTGIKTQVKPYHRFLCGQKFSRILLFTMAGSLWSALVFGQSKLPVFGWRSHFSYRNVVSIAQSNDRVYAATANALFYIDKEELSIHKITKNDGLSEVTIGAIGVDPGSQTLIIGYANGSIDLVTESRITNIRDFRDASLIGGKVIHDIGFNAGLAYLATDQGVLVVNLDRAQIVESYQNLDAGSRISILGLAFSGDSLYAASTSGIFSASLKNEVNRQDFNNWKHNQRGKRFLGIAGNETTLAAYTANSLFIYSNGNWELAHSLTNTIADLDFSGERLVLTTHALYRLNGKTLEKWLNLKKSRGRARVLSRDGSSIWLGDAHNGLSRLNGTATEAFSPKGPASDDSRVLNYGSGQTVLLHGGHSESLSALGKTGEFSRFQESTGWMTTTVSLGNRKTLFDLVDIEIPTRENTPYYLASFGRGLVSVKGKTIRVINEESPNSSLISINGSVNMTAIAREGKGLWMTNYGTGSPLHHWEAVGDRWTAYKLVSAVAKFPLDLYVAPNGDKWMPIDPERGGGIVVFNEKSKKERYLNTNGGQGGLPGSHVTSLVLDDDAFLWVGTHKGIAFYPNLHVILEGKALTASVPIFENRQLLRDEFIASIAIDPANRKWFGTQSNGLWLFSPDGKTQIRHFTKANSPLPSDRITSLSINPLSGELFIGTDKGTVSFRSDATRGTERHENVSIYPNPARRNSLEQIVIRGLVNNALVKITDIAGKLVKELRARGSTALWNGRGINGRVVATGVYLVYSSNSDGTETYVGKIAII